MFNQHSFNQHLPDEVFFISSTFPHSTGAVRVVGNLTPLAGRILEFGIWASDDGNPKRETQGPAFVSVYIEKVNLFPPEFKEPAYEATIQLPTIAGVKIVCVEAFDPDHQRGRNFTFSKLRHTQDRIAKDLSYSLDESTQLQELSKFKLNTQSGCLYVNDPAIPKGNHKLTVFASDSKLTSSVNIQILVDDKIEDGLEFARSRYFAHVVENSTKRVNLLVVGVKNLSPGHNIRYKVLNPNPFLVVKPTSGVVQTTGKPFDREETDHFSLIVQVIHLNYWKAIFYRVRLFCSHFEL